MLKIIINFFEEKIKILEKKINNYIRILCIYLKNKFIKIILFLNFIFSSYYYFVIKKNIYDFINFIFFLIFLILVWIADFIIKGFNFYFYYGEDEGKTVYYIDAEKFLKLSYLLYDFIKYLYSRFVSPTLNYLLLEIFSFTMFLMGLYRTFFIKKVLKNSKYRFVPVLFLTIFIINIIIIKNMNNFKLKNLNFFSKIKKVKWVLFNIFNLYYSVGKFQRIFLNNYMILLNKKNVINLNTFTFFENWYIYKFERKNRVVRSIFYFSFIFLKSCFFSMFDFYYISFIIKFMWIIIIYL